jgi:hypothetical protein
LAVASLVSFGFAAELFNTATFVTHAGQGAGGLDVSMCSVNPNSGGNNMFAPSFKTADDFIVPAGGWTLDGIQLFGYMTGNNPAPWTGYTLNIWQGATPGLGTAVYTTTAAPTKVMTNVYRVFNGTANLLNTDRRINRMTWSLPNVALAAGQYWFDLSVSGGTSGWMNYVMQPNPTNPNDPITVVGNAYQFSGGAWIPAVAGTPTVNVSFPMIVTGIPEPTALVLLALSFVLRRR